MEFLKGHDLFEDFGQFLRCRKNITCTRKTLSLLYLKNSHASECRVR